ncbi:MAG TPA: hypothetical protein VML75_02975 [Kofleriaceae bacterium]|nr:hypothetical protein [Kofleriaceae bacterium]
MISKVGLCSLLACALLLHASRGTAWAQPEWDMPDVDDDDGGDDDDDDDDDDGSTPVVPRPTRGPSATTLGASALDSADPDVLVCDGGWRYPLIETREEIGPARFARQLELQKDLQFTTKAFAFCAGAAAQQFQGPMASARGPCSGLMFLADRVDVAAANLFRLNDKTSCECLTRPVSYGASCEGLREQLTTLRRYDQVLLERAELVLSTEVCLSPERNSNYQLRRACQRLDRVLRAHHTKGVGLPGQFSLSAPLPSSVASGVRGIHKVTDGRYLSVLPENFIGVRQSLCKLPITPVTQNQCTSRVIEPPPEMPKGAKSDPLGPQAFGQKMAEVTWGMCNELALADANASTCRAADVYIDERGQLHLNRPLTTRAERKNATLCVDISDFDDRHPLMVTLGMDPTSSVPKRLWPGETMRIGDLIDRTVAREDILKINVLGKARGVSLTEVLRVNGVPSDQINAYKNDSCRIARSWVPVVDHEVPIGDPRHQKVIPMTFDRGRDGETRAIDEGDYLLLWVRDIEPSAGVLVEYADGQRVGYEPPPLLGASRKAGDDTGADDAISSLEPGGQLRGGTLGVAAPLLPRRARYPGSRVLRLGIPQGSATYNVKVCKPFQGVTPVDEDGNPSAAKCDGGGSEILLDEKIFVHGDSHFGIKFHFGYSYFPIEKFEARRTSSSTEDGGGVHEVVRTSEGTADYDVATLLAVYPFGRNPRRFSYNPLRADYWKHASLLAGFSIRTLTPWNDFYLGAALPVANGVSASLLSHFSRRKAVIGLEQGDLISGEDLSAFEKDDVIAVGVSVGLTFDLNLFERAFLDVWTRLQGNYGDFVMNGSASQ